MKKDGRGTKANLRKIYHSPDFFNLLRDKFKHVILHDITLDLGKQKLNVH